MSDVTKWTVTDTHGRQQEVEADDVEWPTSLTDPSYRFYRDDEVVAIYSNDSVARITRAGAVSVTATPNEPALAGG